MSPLARLQRMARCYSEDARFTPPKERERLFTRAQQLAWTLRFGTPDEVDAAEAEIMDMQL